MNLCSVLDHIPGRWDGRWYLYGQWGCRMGLGNWSAVKDEQWKAGVWTTVGWVFVRANDRIDRLAQDPLVTEYEEVVRDRHSTVPDLDLSDPDLGSGGVCLGRRLGDEEQGEGRR